MDTDTLVEERIDDGQKLVEELQKGGFDVSAALWLQASENGKWYFYIVSPVVDAQGQAQAYRQLHPLVWSRPQRGWIDPLEIKLIGPSNPIAQDVLSIHSRAVRPQLFPMRYRGRTLGNVSVEEAYLYPLPATTP